MPRMAISISGPVPATRSDDRYPVTLKEGHVRSRMWPSVSPLLYNTEGAIELFGFFQGRLPKVFVRSGRTLSLR